MVTMTKDVSQFFVKENPKLKLELEKHCQGVCLTINFGQHCQTYTILQHIILMISGNPKKGF